jgi:hypothetical protein
VSKIEKTEKLDSEKMVTYEYMLESAKSYLADAYNTVRSSVYSPLEEDCNSNKGGAVQPL